MGHVVVLGTGIAGLTTALQFLPMLLLSAHAGLVADRVDQRRFLILTQSAMGLVSAVLAVDVLAGTAHLWHVYLAAFLTGVAAVVGQPPQLAACAGQRGRQQERSTDALQCPRQVEQGSTGRHCTEQRGEGEQADADQQHPATAVPRSSSPSPSPRCVGCAMPCTSAAGRTPSSTTS